VAVAKNWFEDFGREETQPQDAGEVAGADVGVLGDLGDRLSVALHQYLAILMGLGNEPQETVVCGPAHGAVCLLDEETFLNSGAPETNLGTPCDRQQARRLWALTKPAWWHADRSPQVQALLADNT
jgi:hypothetical protein